MSDDRNFPQGWLEEDLTVEEWAKWSDGHGGTFRAGRILTRNGQQGNAPVLQKGIEEFLRDKR